MLQEKNIRTIKYEGEYISECEVLDTDTNETYYVVTQLYNLFYKTFKSSYMDYVLSDEQGDEPECVEGDCYRWFDGESRFSEWYEKTLDEVIGLEKSDYEDELPEPRNNIKYEIINKRSMPVFGCGPMGDFYEIEFLITQEDNEYYNKHVYAFSDDAVGGFALSLHSAYDGMESGNDEYIDDNIEVLEDFEEAKESDYFDLYLEVEKFKC